MDEKQLLSDVICNRIKENLDRQQMISSYYHEFCYIEAENQSLINILKKYDIPMQVDVADLLS
ncbi:hypothetical protein [Butyrivibrio hungatei]|uniref:hypothetical protein n=1 Tax=Butyrivibrio hungatei TaxID=185008 RepID=UPI0008DBF35B|nr:hypothetical protein [Butyrivibrio hungatei]